MKEKKTAIRNIRDEMKSSYLSYAMSVIVSRALPDARDGLKPVHRRIIYAMYKGGYDWSKQYRKSARIVGDVIGKYHPHGDQAVYDAMVRLAQDFSMKVKLLDGQGNFGSIDGDNAAAMRYTEIKLAKITEHLVADIQKNTVDFQNNYDETELEPKVLPSQFPNLLVNGAGGIAVGMATNIPPHNLKEVIDATLAYIKNQKITLKDLMKIIPGPDFPTGGVILKTEQIYKGYKDGRGSIKIRGEVDIEKQKNDKIFLVITSIPYQVNKTVLIEKIANLIRDKKIEGISDLRDESNKDGIRIVIEIKRNSNHEIILNQLYKFSPLESSFGFNTLAIKDNRPQNLSLIDFIDTFLKFREKTIIRKSLFDLKKAKDRVLVLIGLFIAIENIDEVISIIRKSKNPEEAKTSLLKKKWDFNNSKIEDKILKISDIDKKKLNYLSDTQVKSILDLKLQRLTAIGFDEIDEELKILYKTIEKLKNILNNRSSLLEYVKEELINIKNKYGKDRITQFSNQVSNLEIEDVIQHEDIVVTLTNQGYIKRSPLTSVKLQKRGGKGKIGIKTREEDFVTEIFTGNTTSTVLFFSNKGKVFKIKGWKIPEGSNQSKGKPISNLFSSLNNDNKVTSIMLLPDQNESKELLKILFITKKGKLRKNNIEDFQNIQSSGIIAMKLDKGDEIAAVKLVRDDQDVLISTFNGLCLRTNINKIRLFKGRSSKGLKGIKLSNNDEVISLSVINKVESSENEKKIILKNEDSKIKKNTKLMELKNKEQYILSITENGYGKRTSSFEYNNQARGGKGRKGIIIDKKNGNLVACFPVNQADNIMLITNKGQTISCSAKTIRVTGIVSRGVKVLNTAQDEKVVSACLHIKDD